MTPETLFKLWQHEEQQPFISVYTMQACAALGFKPHWNCAKQNAASTALARRLGYQAEREYQVLAWNRLGPEGNHEQP